ncbi:hypothetical protein [Haloactinomyces albus]|uniref:UDP-glucose 6-dehydrogenase n=1 Tax=Haloactinomyces albus TaxID=1352928 RepID=A0AAE3ZBK8_9ACTN|nr:hypothetical protein [Haloactinomyces albus]MDR7300232.1 UDPglucose 6-dehydrogenase [Haloactinomyces albus]
MTTHERTITVVGNGPTALTVGAGLASLGHRVVLCSAAMSDRHAQEPRLSELVRHSVSTGRLRFVREVTDAVAESGTMVVCSVCRASEQPARAMPQGGVLINASVSSGDSTEGLRRWTRPDVSLVSNPLFLRAGSMVQDFLEPDRIVIGADACAATEHVASLYRSLRAEIVRTDVHSADLVRHAVNGYFAVKQCYINALAELCTAVGADIASVAEALAYDARIGGYALTPAPLSAELRHSLELLSQGTGPEQELLHSAAALGRYPGGPATHG